jgi:5-formyltetrahydrofolate cyclo-ligase
LISDAPDLDAIRSQMRQRRADLSPQQRRLSSERICDLLLRDLRFARARTVGLYFAIAGEVDITPLIASLWERKRRICLPVVSSRGTGMRFHRVGPDTDMRIDRFGIPMPKQACPVPRCEIDVLLAPLVAFDGEGQRIGMGAGYFDRFLAPLARRARPSRPRVIGCAYDFQEVPQIPARTWDIPLDAVATEAGIRRFQH